MQNPLLQMADLPPFHSIKPEHVEPAIDAVLAENREGLEHLLEHAKGYTWGNLMAPLEAMDDRLNRIWSPVSHMNSVVNTPELREAYERCLPKLSEYATELGQNEALYRAIESVRESDGFSALSTAQQRVIENSLRDFHLSGVALPQEQKSRFKALKSELATLTTRFSNNLLDATNNWYQLVTDESGVTGLPESSKGMLRQAAEQEGQEGWRVTLEFPSYFAVMNYADDRALREAVYEAYVTRASDQGSDAGKWDNSALMEQILAIRHELAQLLGYQNYAERSLVTKMAEHPQQVLDFLRDLASRSLSLAQQELKELHSFARDTCGMEEFKPWDLAYYGEQLRQEKYAISQEDLKPYFPESRVVAGLFEVVERLYGLDIREVEHFSSWHEDVRFFEIYDNDAELRGRFYLDLYARRNKRGGAWMDECLVRRVRTDGSLQIPTAYLTCNFTPPVGNDPALFTHDEVQTLFHEFGHGLHHMLTRIESAGVAGINGVPWDAVELPSQFMENWCWEREALDLFAAHYKTGAKIPQELFDKMIAAKNFQAGMQMVRQLEFALFDFRLHLEYRAEEGGRIQQILDEVRAEVAVVQPPEYNRFQHGFSHIFSGGYAAGYYSYKWAEVLSADAFSRFEQEGVFNRETGLAFLESVLEQGGSREPMELFIEFRGRKPSIDALLRHSGIAS